MLTRAEASKELFNRGWRQDLYPGVWRDPINKLQVVWFVALQREGIKFDRKDKPWKSKQLEFKYGKREIK
tara:strand:- start:122 stop:331 length:210 start_codon:yes stop_codon:yes gene_type:complete